MILGMSTAAFTPLDMIISLRAIVLGAFAAPGVSVVRRLRPAAAPLPA